MAQCNQFSTLVLLLCISFGLAVYTPWARWILTSKYLNTGKIEDSLNSAPSIQLVGGGSITTSTCTCGYTQLASTDSMQFVADFSSFAASSPTEFGVSIWIYVSSTAGSTPFKFSTDNTGAASSYKGDSTANDGGINFSFTDASGNTDSAKNSLLTVDLGKFYIGKWLFLAFTWVQVGSDVTWKIFLPSLATVEKTSAGSSYPYTMPAGYFVFGSSVVGKFYEVQIFKSVTRTTSTDLAITLVDLTDGTYDATTATCPNSCGTYCYPDYGCLSSTTCQCPTLYTCDANGDLLSCKDTNADFSNSCQCKAGYKLQGSTCVKGIFHIDCPLNCAECSSNTVCTLCNSLFYLHDISGGTECVCNFYAACTATCNSCEPNAACYECATSVVKDEGTCRADSVGFQVSFSIPYVVFNFAHPLERQLTVGNLIAKTADGTTVSTSDWTIDASSTLSQLKVKTSLKQTQLPISLNLKFGKVKA